ncbi:DegV family protein [Macrococcus equipercicus]|uniref:DegV family protein n=1 Tax=Macrococcus equipercicus TaxID=69967 RepID=A0A9Q9BTU6_9STAP|nr:DegV family protein [Macrococcus equipercicus]KAA1042404.1 DegV family protein [Macrococcus equipercicus]UTH14289.1 DegV family protein [Macrococcus equipercicus]
MTKLAWLVDTAAGFTEEETAQYPLFVVPMGVIINGTHYVDQQELSTERFYELLNEYGEGAKTSQPNFQSMLEAYEAIKQEGYDAVIAVHPSSELTGSYQNSVAASKEVDIQSAVIDSKIGAYPYKKMVLEGMKAAEDGRSFDDVVQLVESFPPKAQLLLQPKNLHQLKRSGRVTASQSFLAGLLNIQLILHFEEGKVAPFEKMRTKKKVFERLIAIASENIENHQLTEIAVMNAGDLEQAKKYVEALQALHPELLIHEERLVPVAGVHTGYGTVGIGWLDTKN